MKKELKTRLTVSKIMDAAMNEFGKNGYTLGTINNICSAGINKGLIYHNFRSKDEIYLACLKNSCDKLMQHVKNKCKAGSMKSYMDARMDFFHSHPKETHIFFEALLTPPPHLTEEINILLSEFNAFNETMYRQTLDALTLRKQVTRDDAFAYFQLMQLMLNGYFSSPVFCYMDLDDKVKQHEMTVTKLLDYMLYGIAEQTKP